MLRVREAGARLIVRVARGWRWRRAASLAVVSILLVAAAPGPSAQIRRPSGRPPTPVAARHPPFKAIFEPTAFALDVEFDDVFFVDGETGWACGHHASAAGDGGFVVATRDGGRSWTLQAGDPNSSARRIVRVFFVDATHGWAVQAGGTLLRTTDGTTWQPIAALDAAGPVVFTSRDRGFVLDGRATIERTIDGGRTWQPVYHCRALIATDAPRERPCRPEAIAFSPDGATGYVVTRGLDDNSSAVIKTADGGDTWTVGPRLAGVDGTGGSLVFTDALTGLLRAGRALKTTSDGGASWHDVVAAVPAGDPKILVAGPVGWMVQGREFVYTMDAGKRWNVRTIDFPSGVVSFSLPAPDAGYVVGRGMVYRYRVVPFEYSAPNMLVIPALTGFVEGS